jgi:hypothetical protein
LKPIALPQDVAVTTIQLPTIEFEPRQVTAFETAWRKRDATGEIRYELPYPKWIFLTYLVERHKVLLRGANSAGMEVFRPVAQTDAFGRMRRAVFAASDGVWPMFFAIVDRRLYHGSLSNRCRVVYTADGQTRREYAFSVNVVALTQRPWTTGTVYVLPRAPFTRVLAGDGSPSEEWITEVDVSPMARVIVSPGDFPFLDQIEGHGDATWHAFEELAYRIARGASDLAVAGSSCLVTFADGEIWRPALDQFASLAKRLLPEMHVKLDPNGPRGLTAQVTAPPEQLNQIVAALLSWRS